MIAASGLLYAMVASGALEYAIEFPVLLQALFGFLFANLPLVFLAGLASVPDYVAFPAPLVPACIAHHRWALILCDHIYTAYPPALCLLYASQCQLCVDGLRAGATMMIHHSS